MNLKDKNAIVTGGANGIGRCLVERLLDSGTNVGVLDIDWRGGHELSRIDPPLYRFRECDVGDAVQVRDAIDWLFREFDRIDILVNNAAVICNAPLIHFSSGHEISHDISKWDEVVRSDLFSVFYVTNCVVEKMMSKRTEGVIVNISSIAAAGNAGQSAYSAAKAGIEALTVTWARELAPMRIRVAGIAPGFTNTETTRKSMTQAVMSKWIKATLVKRLAAPSEIVDGIMFVIRNDFFSGRILQLDGGLRI